jgi:hypothetical protein
MGTERSQQNYASDSQGLPGLVHNLLVNRSELQRRFLSARQ